MVLHWRRQGREISGGVFCNFNRKGVMNILKVKVGKDEKITIDYSLPSGNASIKSTLTCADKARQGFYDAFNALAPLAIEICEYAEDIGIQLPVISFSYHGEAEIPGIMFTVAKKLENSDQPLMAITPIKYIDAINDSTSENQILGQAHEKNVLKLLEECKVYIKGDRQQVAMDLEEKENGK